MAQTLRIGTRGSGLAMAQATEVRARLIAAHGLDPEAVIIVPIVTTGDRVRDRPLAEIGGKGLFTKEIEEALRSGAVDLAVHSMKDMPSQLPDGLEIAALLPREDPRDALISHRADSIAALPQGARIGSSSVRRTAQLMRLRPDCAFGMFRGNVETRLRKLDAGEVDATFLACAGLNRLGLSHRITSPIAPDQMLPAPAQGAIGIEVRIGDDRTRALVAALDHRDTAIAVTAERAFLAVLDGSCRTPLAAHARLDGDRVLLRGEALMLDGSRVFRVDRTGAPGDAAGLGHDAGLDIKAQGGDRLML